MRGHRQERSGLFWGGRERTAGGENHALPLLGTIKTRHPQGGPMAFVPFVTPPFTLRLTAFPLPVPLRAEVMGRLDHLVEAVYERFKDRYYPDESACSTILQVSTFRLFAHITQG